MAELVTAAVDWSMKEADTLVDAVRAVKPAILNPYEVL
jgi:hypothetical protein